MEDTGDDSKQVPSSSKDKGGKSAACTDSKKYALKFKTFWLKHPDFKSWLKKSDKVLSNMGDTIVDYYKELQCDRTASTEELKRNYQRLLLSSHPDKRDKGTNEKFILIQEAWSVLREPESRKQYDAMLTCQEHTEVLLYDTVLLSDMTFVASEGIYTYSCRCGGTYLIENSEDLQNNVYIGCDECSFSIQVKR